MADIITLKVNKLVFDQKGFMKELTGIIRRHMDAFEIKCIEKMREIIDDVDTKGDFKTKVKSMVRHIRREIHGYAVNYVVGIDEERVNVYDLMKAYVVAYGMGSLGINKTPIVAGPKGRLVYDNDLNGYHPSEVESETGIELPTWSHAGIDFVDEAAKQLALAFSDMCEDIIADVPPDMLMRYIKVKG